jgi:hypothetical protein
VAAEVKERILRITTNYSNEIFSLNSVPFGKFADERKEELSCHTEWDQQDGDTVLMGTVEGGVGIPDGTERPFHHGGLQQRKRRFGFWRSKPISFGKS